MGARSQGSRQQPRGVAVVARRGVWTLGAQGGDRESASLRLRVRRRLAAVLGVVGLVGWAMGRLDSGRAGGRPGVGVTASARQAQARSGAGRGRSGRRGGGASGLWARRGETGSRHHRVRRRLAGRSGAGRGRSGRGGGVAAGGLNGVDGWAAGEVRVRLKSDESESDFS
ncbi:uncharacterized protein LOC131004660 [Salvia miltiorrhiza]|uniref:uncharacterized protein LOC131004660 n=1 Tax=Salvia miltiorrhiza TaxID=226208 RepID=UPI0025ABF61B|nr:uncharacterized protein LOC131004660 [Salvia miltiorrhiza]